MKKIILIAQSKGGTGKSILAYLLAEKYPSAAVLEMDDATKTTTIQLAYREPALITFLDSNNVIDRGRFNTFLEQISAAKSDRFICDLGASVSEQLPYYLRDIQEFLPEALEALGIELELYCVVGGGNVFTQTMSYLEELVNSSKGQYQLSVCRNEFFELTRDQNQNLEAYLAQYQLPVHSFNISKDKNESTQNRIKEVLKSGKGIGQAGILSKMYFQAAIRNLSV